MSIEDGRQHRVPVRRVRCRARLRPLLAAVLACALLGGAAYETRAAALGPAPGPALLIDLGAGREAEALLYAHRPDQPWHPASLTKLMSLYLAFEALEGEGMRISEPVVASAHAASQPPTRLGVAVGQRLPMELVLKAMIVVSANDASVMLAERLGGSEGAFVRQMNETARRLGLARSRFVNATGLPGGRQQTTARDVARLAVILAEQFPHRYHYFAVPAIRFGNEHRATHNALLRRVAGTDGLKTGFTCEAGYNIVARAVRGSRRLLAVVLGAENRGLRNRFATRLLEAGFDERLGPPPIPLLPAAPLSPAPEPPVRLSGARCHPDRSPGLITDPDRLEGWGVFLGNYADRQAALEALRSARRVIIGLEGRGLRPRPALLERSTGRRPTWKAVVVQLTEAGAGRSCKALWASRRPCVAHSPKRLSMMGYAEQ